MYNLRSMYLSLQNGQKLVCIAMDNYGIVEGRIVVGNVNAKAFGVEYQDGYDVKMIAESPRVAPKMRRMLDDATSTVFKTVPVHYDLVNDIIYTDSLEPKVMSVDKDGIPRQSFNVTIGHKVESDELSPTSLCYVKALVERRVSGEDILRDLKLNSGINLGLKLVLTGMGSWILMQKGKTFNPIALVNTIERQGQ